MPPFFAVEGICFYHYEGFLFSLDYNNYEETALFTPFPCCLHRTDPL
jgi:hypothetical protein